MQDLVGVGIPNPGEAGRFGQCTLDGARQTREPGRERLPGGTGDLQPAPIERLKLLSSPADSDGGPFLGAPFDEPEVSAFRRARFESPLESPDREIPAGREAHRFPRAGTLRPVEPSRHRQVDGAEKVLLELHHELLSDPPHAGGEASDHRFGWRFDRGQEVRGGNLEAGQARAHDSGLDRGAVQLDIGIFGHESCSVGDSLPLGVWGCPAGGAEPPLPERGEQRCRIARRTAFRTRSPS